MVFFWKKAILKVSNKTACSDECLAQLSIALSSAAVKGHDRRPADAFKS